MLCFTKGYQDFSAAVKMRREIKKALYLSVNVFSTKVLTWDIIFTSPTGDGNAINFTWSSDPREGLKTLSIGPAPGIEPTTCRSAVKRSTVLANPAAVK